MLKPEFWIGLLLGIVPSILSNLVTPWVRGKIENSGRSIAFKKSKSISTQFEIIKIYKSDTNALNSYILQSFVSIAMIFSALLLILGFVALINEAIRILGIYNEAHKYIYNTVTVVVCYLSWLMSAILVVDYCRELRATINKVNNFTKYEAFVLRQIGLQEKDEGSPSVQVNENPAK